MTGDGQARPLSVAVGSLAAARDWVPAMCPLGQRLARRFWPGPLTLLFTEGVSQGLAERLPSAVQSLLRDDGGMRLRSPAHDAILYAVREFPGPLVFSEIANSNGAGQVTADVVRECASQCVDLVIDDGPGPYDRPATVVEVQGKSWTVVQAGAITAEQLTQQSACLVVFVCTGNTCRSPLAEGLCKKLLAERLGCSVEALPSRGFHVLSAGLAAMMGSEAAPEAVEVGRGLGADLTSHRTRLLSEDLAARADFVVAMTRGHLMALTDHYPRLGARPRLLSASGDDIPDPIGSPREVYQECADQISRNLEPLVAEIQS
jgi:protein-tyrosine phosphatase